jgi:serine/threonine-protein kinase
MARTLAPGEIIDRYTVLSLLGEGGMAAVYAVRHNTLGSRHALKLLKIENEGIQRRLVAEGQVQASLRHPNIVSVTDVLIVDGQIGLLMEHIDGPALDAWLREHRPSQKDALALFRGILAGVSRAHRAGLVHRDLKPGNVLLDSADGLTIP